MKDSEKQLQINLSENETKELNMCGYVIQDTNIRYLSDNNTFDIAESISLSSIKNLTSQETTVPSDEEE